MISQKLLFFLLIGTQQWKKNSPTNASNDTTQKMNVTVNVTLLFFALLYDLYIYIYIYLFVG